MTYTRLKWVVEFDWNDDGSYEADETARVTALRVERGRSDPLGAFTAGKLLITLENYDRRYDPYNYESAIYPDVMPRRRVRVRVIDYTTLSGTELLATTGFETGGTGDDFNSGAEVDDGTSDTFTDWTNVAVNDGAGDKIEATATCDAGSYAAKITATVGQPYVRQDAVVVAESRYRLSLRTRGNGSVAGQYGIYDATNSAWIKALTSTEITSLSFTEVYHDFTTPASCVSARAILAGTTTTGGGVVYYDTISLQAYGKEHTVFTGRIEEVEPTGHKGKRQMIITAYDGLRDLVDAEVAVALQASTEAGAAIGLVLDAADWPAGGDYRDLDSSSDTMSYWWVYAGTKAKSVIDKLAAGEYGAFFVSQAGKATFINRANYTTAAAAGALDQANIADFLMSTPWSSIYNDVQIRCYPTELAATGDIWKLTDKPLIQAGETLTVWAEYKDSYGSRTAADNVLEPVATTDYTANTASGGGGDDMTASVSITTTIYDTLAQLEIENTHGANDLYMTLLKLRGDAVERTTALVRYEDSASQTVYGRRQLLLDYETQQSVNTIDSLAEAFLEFYVTPAPTVTLQLDNRLDDILSYELCDLVTFTSDEYNIYADMRLDQYRLWTGRTMQDLKAEWTLNPARTQDVAWLLGDAGYSELGDTTTLGW